MTDPKLSEKEKELLEGLKLIQETKGNLVETEIEIDSSCDAEVISSGNSFNVIPNENKRNVKGNMFVSKGDG